jgi:uncharacterized protein
MSEDRLRRPHGAPRVAVFGRVPVAGRCKTRLVPAFSPAEAASLYAAMLDDVLRAALSASGPNGAVFFADGAEIPPRFRMMPCRQQQGVTLVERLSNVFRSGTATVLLATDIPQVRGQDIRLALTTLGAGRPRAVLGSTLDGGFWCLGLDGVAPDFLRDVDLAGPNCADQIADRLRADGIGLCRLPVVLRDIDEASDCALVAEAHPGLGFAAEFRRIIRSRRDTTATG